MRLGLLIAVTMIAFAANSVFNRVAVDHGWIDPVAFSIIRVASGVAVLVPLALFQNGSLTLMGGRRWGGALSLATYMVGFSLAYRSLDAGAGALILFGATQISMFGLAFLSPQVPSLRQVTGAGIAFLGLCWVLWPGSNAPVATGGAALMVIAGIGWGVYSILGRGEADALLATAANFLLALPLTILVLPFIGTQTEVTAAGVAMAVLSGAVTSGLGYALWYRILPSISGPVAATVMLSVPVIAMLAGIVLLGESAGLRLIGGAIVVLGGIAFAVRPARDTTGTT